MNLDRYAAHKRWSQIAARAGLSVPEKCAVSVRSEKDAMTVSISGVFDAFYDFDVREVRDEIEKRQPKSLTMLIESPGGSFIDGLALYSAVSKWRSEGMAVRAEAVGLVASAATLPFLAAGERVAHQGSMFMIHNVWTFLVMVGNAAELEEYAADQVAVMRKMDRQNADIVSGATGMSRAETVAALDKETWYDGSEMVQANICSEVVTPKSGNKEEIKDHAMDAARSLWMDMTGRAKATGEA